MVGYPFRNRQQPLGDDQSAQVVGPDFVTTPAAAIGKPRPEPPGLDYYPRVVLIDVFCHFLPPRFLGARVYRETDRAPRDAATT